MNLIKRKYPKERDSKHRRACVVSILWQRRQQGLMPRTRQVAVGVGAYGGNLWCLNSFRNQVEMKRCRTTEGTWHDIVSKPV